MISGFVHHPGVHCESTAIRNLLAFQGLKLSEPMIFGLGSGLGFIYWDMKRMPFPFVGGRIQPDELTENLSKNIGFKLNVSEGSSPKKAQESLTDLLNQNIPLGLKLDIYHLEYIKNPVHFAAHPLWRHEIKDFIFVIAAAYQYYLTSFGLNVCCSISTLAM